MLIGILKERNVFWGLFAKFCANFSRKRKFSFRCATPKIRIITLIPMFAMYRVKVEIIHFRSFDGGSVRIKGVKTFYFSGAGTFPQFSAGHRNLSCYPVQTPCRKRGNSCLNRIICDFQSTLRASTVHSCAFLLNGVVSPEHHH